MLILATALVARGYTGEGFWSRGHTISEGLTAPRHLSEAEMPDNLCGGTYRSAKKPEKRKLTYAERKEKRKQRLFGKGEGEQMGANEKLRAALEKGKSKKAVAVKPRVTQSKRGRDLRLEAALRREAALKSESAASTSNGGNKEESDTEELSSEYETEEEEETVDVGGGNRMVRIASEGQDDDEWAEFKEEMNTMCSATALEGNKASSSMADSSRKRRNRAPDGNGTASSRPKRQLEDASDTEESDSEEIVFVTSKKVDNGRKMAVKAEEAEPKRDEDVLPSTSSSLGKARNLNEETQSFGKAPKSSPTEENGSSARVNALKSEGIEGTLSATSSPVSSESTATSTLRTGDAIACSVCTMENASSLALCAVCGNVLNRNRTPHWACSSKACRETGYSVGTDTHYIAIRQADEVYQNPNDAVICGCCGERRPA